MSVVCHPDVLILQRSIRLLSAVHATAALHDATHTTAALHDATHTTASLCLYAMQQMTTCDCFAEGAQSAVKTVVEVVDSPSSADTFPGLYLGALPESPFLGMIWLPS